MKLTIIWDSEESKELFKNISEIKKQYELWEVLEVESISKSEKIVDLPALILTEESINFEDILIEGKSLTKDQIKELIEELLGIPPSGWCSSGWCSSCWGGC